MIFSTASPGPERSSSGLRGSTSPEGWTITVSCGIAGALLALTTLGLAGSTEEGLSAVIRYTARASGSVFLLTFVARPLRSVWRHPATAWLLRNRRYLGVGFAVIHFEHLAAILARGAAFHGGAMAEMSSAEIYGGGFIFMHIVSMAATSSDRSAAWVGPKVWKVIHVWGIFGIWIAFLVANGGRVANGDLFFAPMLVSLLTGLGLRLFVRFAPTR